MFKKNFVSGDVGGDLLLFFNVFVYLPINQNLKGGNRFQRFFRLNGGDWGEPKKSIIDFMTS